MTKTTKPKPPAVHCRQCGNRAITVERGQQHRKVKGKRRTAVNAICRNCGWEWWSVSLDAVAKAKAADARGAA